ncbi:alpha/beta fold hydrolase [Bifidobacterium sp. SMB2]|uniref:Alpha/beta fold hydrolase n=1 Tax=Bifidobacterium saimiriisciurei TaxID=2661627 RepID=A0ABX0C9G9_9BIFI|nr:MULTISPECIES: alpha/beta fold hydrolase [Bifidobacterium]NEG96073.1 alpha/beta fold hydrolase [Bifidobacterium sp. SMB2]NEH10849.1 alpha/beta fold hydrolase [Bifidobacterium saimiriisciurei]
MPLLGKYYVPGLYVEDHSIAVPTDWNGSDPADVMRSGLPKSAKGAGDGFPPTLSLFYRVLCAPEHVHDDLPLLVFLQGGPGGQCPRPLGPDDDGWIAEAIKHFRVVLPDQRGTGRSSRIDARVISGMDARRAADYLKLFLADSIIRDFEYLRLTAFDGARWASLGQSYGGFLTLTYLSLYPHGLAASFTTGGIPHVPADAVEVYAHTFPRMMMKTRQYYERYPQDARRVAAIADRLAQGDVTLPNCDPFSVRRLQMLGGDFGMKPSFERLHWLVDQAFTGGDGAILPEDDESGVAHADHAFGQEPAALSTGFLMNVLARTASYERPLYWPLQEFIYADGELERPIQWAAQHELERHPEFAADARPLMFTGEAVFPWMFDEDSSLKPFKPAVELLMEDTRFGRIYDAGRLARNDVPLQAAVYHDDMYVDSGMQLDTLSRVGNSHAWVTNEFEHDGVHHGTRVFRRLYEEALNRGDLADLQ